VSQPTGARRPTNEAAAHPDEQRMLAVRCAVADAFGAHGALARALPGFTPRPSQRDFALAVFDAICERGTLVAEAGTGTGKTLAYLVPALLAGGKVLISTGTKTLQDQIFHKDLATVATALGARVDAALLKGRQNYLCLHRLAGTESEGRLPSRQDATHLRTIVRFARSTKSGDRAELAQVPETATIWPLVTSTRENCLGAECAHYADCFVYKARRAALAADVVVVNHHLFLADLALRDDAIREFLPSADTIVLDEAHQLPKIAADFLGTSWSLAQATELARDALRAGMAQAADGADWVELFRALEQGARSVRSALADAGLAAGSRVALDALPRAAPVAPMLQDLAAANAALGAALDANGSRALEFGSLLARSRALHQEVERWIDARAAREKTRTAHEEDDDAGGRESIEREIAVEPDWRDRRDESEEGEGGDVRGDGEQHEELVRWINLSVHGAQFHATPLAPGAAFARVREQQPQAWILTSATLTLARRFDAFQAEIGLTQATVARWESPFDFTRQALLYLPQPLLSPGTVDFAEQVADAAWPVIRASGGRAFVLCSTLRALSRVADRLRAKMREDHIDLPLLVQGTSTRRALLDEFRRTGNAVLVGSVSFWEGVDVRGEALSLVVIDKLPFAPPDDPVVQARSRRLQRLGRNPFIDYQLPQAVTLLQQGVGRLIRDERDRGVLMILDERLLSKPYGKTVLASLPPFARTRSLADAEAFFAAPPRPAPT